MIIQDWLRPGIRWHYHIYVRNCAVSLSKYFWEKENILWWNNHHAFRPSEAVFNIFSQSYFTRPSQHAHIWQQENLGNTASWEDMWLRERDIDFVIVCSLLFFSLDKWDNKWNYKLTITEIIRMHSALDITIIEKVSVE